MQYPNFNEEKKLWKKGYKWVVGLDEAGRGPLAGPVVAAAVTINVKRKTKSAKKQFKIQNLKEVKDSKKLSPKKREELYKILIKHSQIEWGVGRVSEKVIDKINILEATKLAMQKALRQAQGKLNKNIDYLIIDGNFKIYPIKYRGAVISPEAKLFNRVNSKIPQKSIIATASHNCSLGHKRKIDFSFLPSISIIKADEKVFSCAAASIIAKVSRDRIMLKYDKKYPKYGFKKHKGYPTKFHRKIIRKIGPCPIHRKSFSWT